jgi:hypothetical protein
MFYKKDGAGCIAIQKRLLPLQAERKAMLALALPSRDKSHNEVINHKLQHLGHW